MTVIDNSSAFKPSTIFSPMASTTQPYPTHQGPWIEWLETNKVLGEPITHFSADFNVPKKPVNTVNYNNNMRGSVSTIWTGLQSLTDDQHASLLQPVLEWYVKPNLSYPDPSEANWSIATWYVSTRRPSALVSTRRYGDGVNKNLT